MSKRAGSKGDDELERLVEAWLELAGWKTHRAAAVLVRLPGGRTFSKSHDIFGVFDILACRACTRVRCETCNATGIIDDGGEYDYCKVCRGNRTLPSPTEGEAWALQATVPDMRSARRAKVAAAGPWPRSWRVSVLSHLSARVGRETLHWFVVEDLVDGIWREPVKIQVDVKGLEAHRRAKAAAKKAARAGASRALEGGAP